MNLDYIGHLGNFIGLLLLGLLFCGLGGWGVFSLRAEADSERPAGAVNPRFNAGVWFAVGLIWLIQAFSFGQNYLW